jgi:hypothetical protein
MSSQGLSLALIGLGLLAASSGLAQYPGQVNNKAADKTPEMRAVAVLEWTGDAGKPTASRIVPVSIYDGEQLQDAGLYLARPYPLAISYAVEYELKDNGKTIGLFEVKNAGQVQGSWVGFGDWKPLPKPKAVAAAPQKIDEDWEGDDKPVLHRKHKADGSSTKSGGGSAGSTGDAKGTSSQDDSDRPKLHKKTDDSSASGSGSSGTNDSDHPTLHKKTDDGTADNSGGSAPVDPDRPTMTKPKPKAPETPVDAAGNVSSLPDVDDPDRPRLKRGARNLGPKVEPTLMGLPDDMKQAVAVSDARNRPEHPWTYSWANPDDEMKMKEQMEDIARKALGIVPPAPPAKTATAHRSTAAKKVVTPPPAAAPSLESEQFRVFELAYGAGATMVLTAHSTGPLADQKFVTLIAQPDLYGNVLVLMKNVTDGTHLDETPRMRLVDAVDALADNRGELLFELRGDTNRQFVLYRILRGRADKLFTTFGGNFGSAATE